MNFTLRQKISAVFLLLLAFAALVAWQSIRRFNRLGRSIDVILKENYRSVIACQQMKDALERIDSGLLFILSNFVKEGVEQIEANRAHFKDALEVELNNLTLPEESARANELKSLFGLYDEGLKAFLTSRPDALRAIYSENLFPMFQRIKSSAESILQMNQENMNAANNRARRQSAEARRDMYFFLALSALSLLLFMLFSNHWILQPIKRFIASAQEIRRGNLNLVIQVDTRDEIGQLSEAFNDMAASLRLFRRSDQMKLLRIQRSTQEAFKNLPAIIAIVDAEGMIEIATSAARTTFGLVPNTPIEQAPYPWLAEIYRQQMKNQAQAAGGESKQDIVQQFSGNQERFYRPRLIPIFNDEKEFNGSIIILEDVTLLMQNEEIKKDLFSTISHQLKTPLTSIRMALHLLLEQNIGGLNEKQADLLVTARDESERLNGIIEDLLDIRRLESGSVRLGLGAVPVRELVEEACAPFSRLAQDKGQRLEIDLPAGLPEVCADRSRITYVFANLLSNAIKYSPVGGVIRVSAQPEGDAVVFSVSDDGRGIPKKYHKRVFEKFFRVPGQDTSSGVGLGLSIAREIVGAHHGRISFRSVEGRGTTFFFSLETTNRPDKGGS